MGSLKGDDWQHRGVFDWLFIRELACKPINSDELVFSESFSVRELDCGVTSASEWLSGKSEIQKYPEIASVSRIREWETGMREWRESKAIAFGGAPCWQRPGPARSAPWSSWCFRTRSPWGLTGCSGPRCGRSCPGAMGSCWSWGFSLNKQQKMTACKVLLFEEVLQWM